MSGCKDPRPKKTLKKTKNKKTSTFSGFQVVGKHQLSLVFWKKRCWINILTCLIVFLCVVLFFPKKREKKHPGHQQGRFQVNFSHKCDAECCFDLICIQEADPFHHTSSLQRLTSDVTSRYGGRSSNGDLNMFTKRRLGDGWEKVVEGGNSGKLIMTHNLIILRRSEDTRNEKKEKRNLRALGWWLWFTRNVA